MHDSRPNGRPTREIFLEDIISERKKGKTGPKIAEALTLKYGTTITEGDMRNFLNRLDPPRKLKEFGPASKFKDTFTLDDIIYERKKGKSGREIAEALSEKYGINITEKDIGNFLKRFDPPKRLKDFDSPGSQNYSKRRPRRPSKYIKLEDIIAEREKGKSGPKIAEALTSKYGTTITPSDINNFLHDLNPPRGLKEFGPASKFKDTFTLDDIIYERKKGKSGPKIAEALTLKYGINITATDINNFLRRLDPPRGLKELDPSSTAKKHSDSRSNPVALRHSAPVVLPASIGLGSSMAIAKVLDMKYPTMSGTKRSLIAGGVPAGVSLGIYAKTKDEAALWGLAGSVIGTALSAYIFKK